MRMVIQGYEQARVCAGFLWTVLLNVQRSHGSPPGNHPSVCGEEYGSIFGLRSLSEVELVGDSRSVRFDAQDVLKIVEMLI